MQNRVRETRRAAEITQERLCEMADISRWTLIRIERHPGHRPAYDTMRNIARRALGMRNMNGAIRGTIRVRTEPHHYKPPR